MILGIGTDIIQNNKININLAHKTLSKKEMIYYNTLDNDLKHQMLGSRLAAKEAIIKATNKQYLFKDIILEKENDKLVCTNIEGIELSISHEKEYSIAFAIYQKKKIDYD